MEALSRWGIGIVYGGVYLLEAMGLLVILAASVRSFWMYWTAKDSAQLHFSRLHLGEGLATGLEFKLGGEILRTVVVKDLDEIGMVGAIVALRIIMAFMIYWEIKQESTRGTVESQKAAGG